MRVVVLGPPGGGKGTQARRVAARFGVPHVALADLVREAIRKGTPLGQQAKAFHDAGMPVPDEIALALIRQRLARRDAARGYVLDGFPRNAEQARVLDEMLAEIGRPLDLAILIEMDFDLIVQRVVGRRTCAQCGRTYNIFLDPPLIDDECDECGGRLRRRADDNEETISNRLRTYEGLIGELAGHYRERGLLRSVDGNGEVDEVFAQIEAAVTEGGVGGRARASGD
ncbi:adenylate kinase [Inmirania thermothiophila]|uniref:Adenylate kinase n=1 Tax=Inmirania thermothiophila TaxID=1750597 RepID=A0A3N1Y7N7_9GAMM|nr:adenylate kinase [Inmirania thermothiophila]ROR34770.1 adenylate kinase [Inmirania thermothiophila]